MEGYLQITFFLNIPLFSPSYLTTFVEDVYLVDVSVLFNSASVRFAVSTLSFRAA